MQIQTVFKAGNSNVIAIPKDLSRELKIAPGQEVTVTKIPGEEAIVIKKAAKTKKTKEGVIRKEFKVWLDKVLKEDKEILDELAVR